jgi:hypothetical protein
MKMNEDEIKSLIDMEIDNSIGYIETETVEARTEALNAYLRNPYGNEVEGQSQIVTGEVAEAVDGALPQLMRVFTSNDDAVQFEPVSQGDEPFAKQASQLANWVFYKQNDGFLVMHNWFKDALLQKVGIVKAYWDEKKDTSREKYKNLTDDELALLAQDGEFEIVKQEVLTNFDANGMPYNVYNITIERTKDNSRIIVENVPPEEFLIDKRARTIEDAQFCAHRRFLPRGDLIAMGYDKDKIEDIPAYDRLSFAPERLARYSNGEMPEYIPVDDPSMQEVEVFECYIKADFNGTGINTLNRVVIAGEHILEMDDCDYVPFHSLCPIPIPHKFFGQSLADRTTDIQLEKTTLTRQLFNNLYLTNNARVVVVEGQVNYDDLLTSTAGGVIRAKNINAIQQLNVTNTAGQTFPMFEYLDNVQAKRTGVSDMQQGLDPSVLQNTTATAVAAMTQQSTGKLELIARIFAETGVKSLFKGILHLLCKYQDREQTIKLSGNWVSFDPREWSDQYNVTINVGLGNGNRQEQIATLQMIMAKQEQILQGYGMNNPLVTLGQYQKTLSRMIEMAGFKDTTSFLNDITPEIEQQVAQQASQEKPDPSAEATKMFAEIERAKAELKAQTDNAKNELERERMMANNAIKQLEMQQKELEMQQKAAKDNAELALKEMKLQLEAQSMENQDQTAQTDSVMKAIKQLHEMAKGDINGTY